MLPYEHIRANSTWNVYRSTGTETASYERVAVVCLPPRDTAPPIKAGQCVKVEVNMVQSGRRYLLLISICNFRLFLRFLVSRHFVAVRVNRIQCACFLKSPEQTTKNKGNNRPEWFCIYRSSLDNSACNVWPANLTNRLGLDSNPRIDARSFRFGSQPSYAMPKGNSRHET